MKKPVRTYPTICRFLVGLSVVLPAVGNAVAPSAPGITTDDIIRLRDVGGFSVSPDGRWLVFSVRHALQDLSDYGVNWFVMPADGNGLPVAVDVPEGRPISTDIGLPSADMPRDPIKWSPDGKRFAFRRREGERIELWQASVASRHAQLIHHGQPQVARFGWSRDGLLVLRTGFDPVAFSRAIAAEAEHGWLLDRRMTLWAAQTPLPSPPNCSSDPSSPGCDVNTLTAMPEGSFRTASVSEADSLANTNVQRRVWAEPTEPDNANAVRPLRRIWAQDTAPRMCASPHCVGQFITEVGLARNAGSVWFLKRVDERGLSVGPRNRTALFEWRLHSGEVRSVFRGDLKLEDCQAHAATLFCRGSSATSPARIVAIDLTGGRLRSVFDPNEAWRSKRFPVITELPLRDPEGNFGYAHLVYPNNYRAGSSYPAVVVQYRSSGFLLGGTGGEYPILPLAAEGFFVLSVDIPHDTEAWKTLGEDAAMRRERIDRRGQRNAAAAIEAALDSLISQGLVDPQRIALTGLSYGAEVVHYALQHTGRFACAIASQGSMDVSYFAQFPEGPQRAKWMSALDATSLSPSTSRTLLDSAWSQQPERLRTPLLLNLAQAEALFGFEGFKALQYAGRPVEVRVFPEDGHLKYRPKSFVGVYDNNIQWLKFWLLGIKDPGPEFTEQYRRWETMKAQGPPDHGSGGRSRSPM